MFRRNKNLTPRNGHTLHVAIVARISGCENQKGLSLDDQIDHAKDEVKALYSGPVEYHVIATKAKGERLDRDELQLLEELIRSGILDLIVAEDLGRIVRGTEAVRLLGIAVDHGVRAISPNDGIDTSDPEWEKDAIAATEGHVSHQSHTSQRIKNKLMNRFRKFGGAPARPIRGYLIREDATTYDEWTKDPDAEPVILEGARILKTTLNCSAVADWFNRQEFAVGPYCRRNTWTGAMVRRFFKNPLLKGKPARGTLMTIKFFEEGRRKSVKNPDGPTYRDCPHLAYFSEAEFDSLNAALSGKNSAFRRKRVAGEDPLSRVPRKRTRFPGQHARCWYCGRHYVWGGNGISTNLMCSGAREWKCWNSIGFRGETASRNLIDAIMRGFRQIETLDDQFAAMVQAARNDRVGDLPQRWASLESREIELVRQQANLAESLTALGPKPFLLQKESELKARGDGLQIERGQLEDLSAKPLDIPDRLADVWTRLHDELNCLATNSPEFGDLMRQLVPEFSVYLMRRPGGGRPLPRARVRVNLAGCIPDVDRVPALREWFSKVWTIDLASGIENSEFSILRNPPESYKRMRRHSNQKFRFEPLEGYEPPVLE